MKAAFYLYGVVEILTIIYFIRDYLISYKENPNKEDVIIDVLNPREAFSKIKTFNFLLGMFSFSWVIIGLFTTNAIYFMTLLFLTFCFIFLKEQISVIQAKNIFIINSLLKIIIILYLIYNQL